MMPLQQLGELHQREANLLRQFASKELPRPRTRISRYRQGREHVAFMYSMVSSMRELCGAPQFEALAAIINIAFPDADATAEKVRSSCRPTTRSDQSERAVHTAVKVEHECAMADEASEHILSLILTRVIECER